MATNFNRSEARNLARQFQQLVKQLGKISASESVYRDKIRKAVDAWLTREALNILKEVPVEELNKNKEGFRTTALREHGYETMADVWTAKEYQLASVYGVSEDSAYRIKKRAREYLRESIASVKVRLSYDRKDQASTQLVQAISAYRHSKNLIENSQKLLQFEQQRIRQSIEALNPTNSGISWFFSSRDSKDRARVAYENLYKLLYGQYGQTAEWLIRRAEEVSNISATEAWEDFRRNNVVFYNILEEIAPESVGSPDSLYGLPEDLAKEILEESFFPEGLKCTLRSYQELGVKYILHQGKVLLGDEMGLGKTVQAIATMVSLRNTGSTHFMVVCPASVISNWTKEVPRHSKLRSIQIYGRGRASALKTWQKTGGVGVTTYETVGALDFTSGHEFDLLVVDEAHYIKNIEAQRSRNVRELCAEAERILFLTGTALENKVEEMISLINVLQPDIARQVQNLTFMSSAPQFREKVAPVYFRRKREDVLKELPEKVEKEEWCNMTPYEERVYEDAVLSKDYAGTRRVSWIIDDLRYSSKARRLMELVEEAEEDDRKVLVFTFFLDTAKKICALMGDRCMPPINGSVPPVRRQQIIDEFEDAPAGSVLVCQIQSGGTGLNIQSASVVVICEPQFKPSIENQAISRAYRMGQGRNVFVHRLLCVDTVDEKVMELLEQKQAIFDAFADKSVAAEAQKDIVVDEKGYGKIIEEEIERIKKKNAS